MATKGSIHLYNGVKTAAKTAAATKTSYGEEREKYLKALNTATSKNTVKLGGQKVTTQPSAGIVGEADMDRYLDEQGIKDKSQRAAFKAYVLYRRNGNASKLYDSELAYARQREAQDQYYQTLYRQRGGQSPALSGTAQGVKADVSRLMTGNLGHLDRSMRNYQSYLDAYRQGKALAIPDAAGRIDQTAKLTPAAEALRTGPDAADWEGRDKLIEEYRRLQNKLENAPPMYPTTSGGKAATQRLKELREKLDAGEMAAGNAPRAYSVYDVTGGILGSAAGNIGASLTSAASTVLKGIDKSNAEMRDRMAADRTRFVGESENGDPLALRNDGTGRISQTAALRGYRQNHKLTSALDAGADELSDSAAQRLQLVKGGAGPVGGFAVDMAENALEMGFDAGVAALTGGSSLGSMAARVFGQSAQEARQEGASFDQQLAYGAAKSAIEVLTEMLGGLASGIVYGPGATDELAEELIRKLAKSDGGRTAARFLIGAAEEGGEEVLSDLMSPLAEMIYKQPEGYDLSEMLYDFTLGAAMGAMGGGVSIATGQNAAANAALRLKDAQQAAASGRNTGLTDSDLDEYLATGTRQHVRNEKAALVRSGESPILKTLDEIKSFIRDSLTGKTRNTIKAYGRVGSRMANDIMISSGGSIDTTGYYLELDGNRIGHMSDHVENDADARNIPLTPEQIERLTEYIDEYDEVLDVLTRKDGSTRIYLDKMTDDGHIVVVELASKGRSSLQPVTAWQNTPEAFARQWEQRKTPNTSQQESLPRGYKDVSQSASTTRSTASQEAGQEQTSETRRGYGAEDNIAQPETEVKTPAAVSKDVTVQDGRAQRPMTGIRVEGRTASVLYRDGDGEVQAVELSDAGLDGGTRAFIRELTDAFGEAAPVAWRVYPGGQSTAAFMEGARAMKTLAGGRLSYDDFRARFPNLAAGMGVDPELGRVLWDSFASSRTRSAGLRDEDTRAYRGGDNAALVGAGARPQPGLREFSSQQSRAENDSNAAQEHGREGHVSLDGAVFTANGETVELAGVDPAALTQEQRDTLTALEFFAQETGIDFAIFTGSEEYNGAYKDGTIYLNIDAHEVNGTELGTAAVWATASHELTHHIQQYAPAEYEALRDIAIDLITRRDGMTLEKAIDRELRILGEGATREDALDEVIANGCELMLRDSAAVREVFTEHRSLAQAVLDFLRDFWEKLKNAVTGLRSAHPESAAILQNAADEVKELRDAWDAGLRAALRSDAEESGTADARYSLNETPDGQPYVEVDVDQGLFDGLTPREQLQMAREVIRERFVGSVIGTTNRAFVNGETAAEYAHPAKPIRDADIMEAKARASTELNNLMDAGTNFRTRPDGADGHTHANAVGGFSYFDVTFRVGGKLYQGVINLENNSRGVRLKDITKIRNITEGDYSSGETSSRTASQGDVSGDSIRNTSEKINPNYSRNLTAEQAAQSEETVRERLRAAERAIGNLQRQVDYWKGQTKRTDVKRLANGLNRSFNGRADVTEDLTRLANYIANAAEEDLKSDYIARRARSIAAQIVDSATMRLDPDPETRRGLTDYLKRTAFAVDPADAADIPDFDQWKRLNRGAIRIKADGAPIDGAYQELRALYGEGLFPADVTAASDQLAQIRDAYDAVKTEIVNPYAGYRDQAVLAAADAIVEGLMSGEVRREGPTFADRMQARMDAAVQRERERTRAVRAEKNAKIHELIAEKNAKIEAARQAGRERLQDYRERRNERDSVAKQKRRVVREYNTLYQWFMRPGNKDVEKHVPAVVKEPIADFLKSIDLSSERSLKADEAAAEFLKSNGLPAESSLTRAQATQADLRFRDGLARLEEAVRASREAFDQTGYSALSDLPEGFMDRLHELQRVVQAFMDSAKGQTEDGAFVVNRMDAAQLKALGDTLANVRAWLRSFNRFHQNAVFQHVSDAADSSVTYMRKLEPMAGNKATDYLLWNGVMRPAYGFKRFGEGGEAIWDELTRGQDKMAFNLREIVEFAKKTYTPEQVKAWEGERQTFTLESGESVTLPVSQIMSFYELMKRPQGLQHLTKGGARGSTYKDAKGKKHQDAGHELTAADLARITDSLTQEQRDVADALQGYMARQGGAWGNEVSLARFGEELFTEKEYFPILTDASARNVDSDTAHKGQSVYDLLNKSFTKELTPKAGNRVMLYSIFDVFAQHMSEMAEYNALALPVLDTIKWLNYRDADGTGVRDAMRNAFGESEKGRGYAESFVKGILEAFNGTETESGGGFPSRALHNYNRAAVAFNLRVVAQQPMSILRAAEVLDFRSLGRGLSLSPAAIRESTAEMLAHSGIAVWKELGFYDVNVSQGVTELIRGDQSLADRLTEFGMKGAETADRLTWAAMWRAAKAQVQSKNHLTTADGDAYWSAVTELFEKAIYETQVVDSVLTKGAFIRQKDLGHKMLSSFMGEPTTTASMLIDAALQYRTDLKGGMSKAEAWRKNRGRIARTAVWYSLSALALSAAQSAVDALRDDDKYEDYWERFLEAYWDNLKSELDPLNLLPGVDTVLDAGKYLVGRFFPDSGISGFAPSGGPIDNIWKPVERLLKALENPNYTTWYKIYQGLQTAAGLTGLPTATAAREAVAAWNITVGSLVPRLHVSGYDAGPEKEIGWAVEEGWLDRDEAVRYYMRDTDMTREKAEAAADYHLYMRDHPESAITEKAWVGYADGRGYAPHAAGIVGPEVFDEVFTYKKNKGGDKQREQEEVWAYIDGLNLTREQKDALHLCFYAKSTLKDAPWH